MDAVARNPDVPVTLCCNVGEVYAYQDPGTAEDTAEGPLFNIRRDLEILHKLNLMPGVTLPARILLNRLLDYVESLRGICFYDTVTAAPWAGCRHGTEDDYQRIRAAGIEAIIPARSREACMQSKADSLKAMVASDIVDCRPHILVCSVCQYGNGTRPPFAEDNLPELLAWILESPDVRVRLVPHADWMMCGPCPYREDRLNACVNNRGTGGLSNQMRDLRVLQILGLSYGDVMNGRALYRLLLERIPGTYALCHLDASRPSVWWTGCGAADADSPAYAKGRQELMPLVT